MDILKLVNYDPGKLFDAVAKTLGTRSNAALARKLNISAPIISRMRERIVPVNSGMLVRMYDRTGMSIDELRSLGGIPRTYFVEEEE